MPYDRGDVLAAAPPRGRGAGRGATTTGGTRVRARLDAAGRSPGCASFRGGRRRRDPAGLRAAALPVRPARRPAGGGRRARRRRASTCRSGTPDRPAARRRSSRPWPRSGAERGYPPSIGTPALREAAAGWMARRLGVDGRARPAWPPASAPRSSWPALPAVAAPPPPRPRHRAVPGGQLPDLRDGRHARRLPGRARAGRRPTGASTSPPSTRPTPSGPSACGSTRPGNPTGGLDDLGGGRRLGPGRTACRCSATSATSSSPGTGPRRSDPRSTGTDGVLAVHSLSKRSNLAGVRVGFYAGDPELVRYLARGAQARRVHGARPGPGRRRRRPRRRRPRRGAARRATAPPRARWPGSSPTLGVDAPLPGGGFYLWVPAPDGDAWALARRLADRRRRAGQPRRVLRRRPAPATSASPWCARTPSSTSSPIGPSRRRRALTSSDPPATLTEPARAPAPYRRRMADLAARDRRAVGAPRRARARRRRRAGRPSHEAIDLLDAGEARVAEVGRRRRGRRPRVAEAGDPAAVPLSPDGDHRARAVRVRRQDPAQGAATQRPACGSCPARRPAGARSSTAASILMPSYVNIGARVGREHDGRHLGHGRLVRPDRRATCTCPAASASAACSSRRRPRR